MKTVNNTIRIGMVRKSDFTTKSNEEQTLSKPHTEKRHVDEKLNRGQHNRISDFDPSNNVRVHDISDIKIQKPPASNDYVSNISSIQSYPSKQSVKKQHQVPIKQAWSTTTKVIIGTVVAVGICAVIVVPTVLGILLTRQSDTIIASTTAVTSPVITAYWTFDGNVSDYYNMYNGGVSTGNYSVVNSSTMPYIGRGQAMNFDATSSQSYRLSYPVINLSYRSFTIEAWIYVATLTPTADRGIFGHCQCSTCSNQCFSFVYRSNRLAVDFSLNDLTGVTTVLLNNWYHVAFVYNYQTQQQILYVNGVLDAIKSNAAPYQGQNASIYIGVSQVYSNTLFFHGFIDNVLLTTRAKSTSEILADASIVAHYSFDLPNPEKDRSINRIDGILTYAVTIVGRVNQAMRINGNGSYFTAYGFPQTPMGLYSNRTFSVSLWIYPTSGGTFSIVQLTPTSTVGCANLLGIYSASGSTGQLVIMGSNTGQAQLVGPFVSQNVWTHVTVTYSQANGYTLYSNGVLFGSTGTGTTLPTTSGTFANLNIGFQTTCATVNTYLSFQGGIDEVYVHNRELTQADVTALANP